MVKKERFRLRGGGTLESQWQIKEFLEFVYQGGKDIVSDAVSGMSRSYNRRAPRETGRLAGGFNEASLQVRNTPNIYYREMLVSPVEYAKVIEYEDTPLGVARKARRSARVKANKRLKNEIRTVITSKLRRLR